MKRAIALVLGAIGIVVALAGTHARDVDDGPPPAPERAAQHPPALRHSVDETDTHTTPSATLPHSLTGTDPDGDLAVTTSRGTIRLFDYYLTTLGETDLAGVRALVAAEARRQAPERADEVLALFDRYTAYLQDLQDLHPATTDDYVAQMLALQQTHFGADAGLLFDEDNAVVRELLASARNRVALTTP